MKPAFVMLVIGALCALGACDPAPSPDGVEALAADPARLKALRAQCQTDREAACQAAAEAFRRRFLAGTAGPDEYTSPAELPPIPPSFEPATDEPTADEPDASPAEVSP